jgi:hypothetical protein
MESTALRVYDSEKLSKDELKQVIQRPRVDFSSILSTVRAHSCCTTSQYKPTVCTLIHDACSLEPGNSGQAHVRWCTTPQLSVVLSLMSAGVLVAEGP